MKKIHITQIIPTLNFGGAERTVVDIINSCDPERFTFSVLTFFDELPLAQELKRSDVTIRVVYKKPYETLGLMRRIRDQLRELRPDVVHTHLFGADVWGKRAAHQLHLPVVSTEHNLNYQENILKHGIKRFLCPPSDRYVATSEAIKVYMKQKYGVQKPIEVIRCGIDLKRFNDRPLDTSFPLQHLLIVGRLTRQKGHAVALRALQQLVEFPWYLTIVGDGELRDDLCNLVRTLGLEKRITFVPATADIDELYQVNQLVLVPSLWEGLGIVVMEAMAEGRVVVASAVGGIPELIQDQVTGLLVTPNNVTALRDILGMCFKKWPKIRQLGDQARMYAQSQFSVQKMARAYEKIYLDLAKK